MILYIDTHDHDKIVLALLKNGRAVKRKIIKATARHSEKLLVGIKKLVPIKQVKSIIVVRGPGSFSSLRIGIATANTLAFVLKIPLYSVPSSLRYDEASKTGENLNELAKTYSKLKKDRQVVPYYGKEPNITKAK